MGYEKYIGCRSEDYSKYNVLAQAKYKYAFSWWDDVFFYVAPGKANYMVKTSVKNDDTSWQLHLTSCGDKGCRAKGEIIYD